MQDPQSLHKYAYVHGDPVQGIDPSGEVTIAGLLSSIKTYGHRFGQQGKSALKASTKFYKVLVSLVIVLNQTVAFQDPKLLFPVALAVPNQLKMLKKFNRTPPAKLQSFVLRKITDITRVIGQSAIRSAAIAALRATFGVHLPMKQNGQPDLTSILHPGPLSTIYMPLTGKRSKDERLANTLSLRLSTPKGYTWHHHEVIGVMQLVRKDVHRALFGGHKTHYGGVFFWELLNNKKYKR